jgi:hypothetical protein
MPRSMCKCSAMNPGVTYLPRASMTLAAVAFLRLPIAAIRSPRMPMSVRNQGFPVSSSTRPPVMSKS